MQAKRTFTICDGAVGPVVYRYKAESVEALALQLGALSLTKRCALDAATAAWGGCVAGFADVALMILPGDHPVVFAEYGETQ